MALIKDIPTHAVEQVLIHGAWYAVDKASFQIHAYQYVIPEGTVYSGGDAFSLLEKSTGRRLSGPVDSIQAVRCSAEGDPPGRMAAPDISMDR
jgi:hypothetical protein